MTKSKNTSQYEAYLVSGMMTVSQSTQYALMKYCSDYFWDNYHSVFFADEYVAKDILQDTHIKLWENIEDRRIYVEDSVLMGSDGKPLRSSLLTYFMGIARLKYLEYVRSHIPSVNTVDLGNIMKRDDDEWRDLDFKYVLYGDDDNTQRDIIADCISKMSPNCCNILTKYYYEGKSYDAILAEIGSISTKDALKNTKARCMKTLRERANDIYRRYVKAS